MDIDIDYIQSRGYQQEKGYSWTPEEPKILAEIPKLIDGEYFSLVIYRYQKKLLLYVTALESNRVDFRGRKIRNSVLWECESNLEEKLWQVAALALQNQLSEKIENAITEDENSTNGFKVDLDKIKLEKLTENQIFEPDDNYNSQLDRDKNYLANNNSHRLQELAKELKAKKLPNREGMLIVVTTSTTEAELKKAEVWRGICDLVVTEKEQPWKEIEIKENLIRSLPKFVKSFFLGREVVPITTYFSLATLSLAIYLLHIFLLSPSISDLVHSNSLSICEPVKFEGRYNPIKTKNIFLEVDGKYIIGNSEKEEKKSKIILNPMMGTWNFTYQFNTLGENRQVILKATYTDNKVIDSTEKKQISVTVKDCPK